MYPAGQSAPTASNLNFTAGRSVPNLVEAGRRPVGRGLARRQRRRRRGGRPRGLRGARTTGGAGLYNPLATPARICDTRPGNPSGLTGGDAQCNGGPATRAAADGRDAAHRPGDGNGGVPASGVAAVVLNVTAVGPAAKGYLTVYPAG